MPLNFRTYADMSATIAKNLHKIDRTKFDVVIGIPRSGMFPAAIISTSTQIPMCDLRGYAEGNVYDRSGKRVRQIGNRILLVDDSCNKGRAFQRAIEQLPDSVDITRLAVFGPYQRPPEELCDIHFEVVHGPRIFAWNWMKHKRLPRWAFDFDGVLCRNPDKRENDDGPRYLDFIRNAEPIFLPRRPIGHIVTARLEKYREPTIEWLNKHGVHFESLNMMPYETKAERMAAGNRGGWKATVAKELGVELFVESSPKQSRIIARDAQMPVFCTEDQLFYDGRPQN